MGRDGKAGGFREGLIQGKEDAKIEVWRELVQMFLGSLYGELGDWVGERLKAATAEDLLSWYKQLLSLKPSDTPPSLEKLLTLQTKARNGEAVPNGQGHQDGETPPGAA